MRAAKRILFGSKKRAVISAAILALVCAGTALAIIVFTGVTGSASGSFEAGGTQNSAALQVNGTTNPVLKFDGTKVPLSISVKNLDANAAHSLTALSVAFTAPSGCASHMNWFHASGSTLIGTSIAAGATVAFPNAIDISLDASTPASCATGSWTAAFTGTTS